MLCDIEKFNLNLRTVRIRNCSTIDLALMTVYLRLAVRTRVRVTRKAHSYLGNREQSHPCQGGQGDAVEPLAEDGQEVENCNASNHFSRHIFLLELIIYPYQAPT